MRFFVVLQRVDDIAECEQPHVDGYAFLLAGALRVGALQPLAASQIHQMHFRTSAIARHVKGCLINAQLSV